MHPDQLFLRRFTQLRELTENEVDEVAMLDLASLIRQLLLDQYSLVDVVNASKLKLKFVTCRSKYSLEQEGAVPQSGGEPPITLRRPQFEITWASIDAIGSGLPETERVSLTKDQFGKHVVGRIQGKPFTVKMIVKLAANINGGRHYDVRPKDPELSIFEHAYRDETPNPRNINMFSAQVVFIGRVVKRALEPLVDEIVARHPDLSKFR